MGHLQFVAFNLLSEPGTNVVNAIALGPRSRTSGLSGVEVLVAILIFQDVCLSVCLLFCSSALLLSGDLQRFAFQKASKFGIAVHPSIQVGRQPRLLRCTRAVPLHSLLSHCTPFDSDAVR